MLKKIRDTKAQEIAEFAMILPVMVTLMLGIFQFGRAYHIYAVISTAAIEGARLGALPGCATCQNNVLLTPDQIGQEVERILGTNGIDSRDVVPGSCSGFGDVTTATVPTICVNQDHGLTRVHFVYPYDFGLPLGRYGLNLYAQAESVQ